MLNFAVENTIGDKGTIAIADSLKINTTLTFIALSIFDALSESYYNRREQ
jgi:hypothetical protein